MKSQIHGNKKNNKLRLSKNLLMLLVAVLGTSVMVTAAPAPVKKAQAKEIKATPIKEVKATKEPKAKSGKKAKSEKMEAPKSEAKVKK